MAQPTHPGIAMLADPLFGFAGKRVEKMMILFNFFFLAAEQLRVKAGRTMVACAAVGA